MNKPAYIMRDESITVFCDGKPHTINSTHLNFRALRKAILDAKYDEIPSLLSIESKIADMTHGNIKIVSEKLYYRNHEIRGVVVDKLFKMLKEGASDATPLINFIERIMSNPSANSVNELYTFLSYRDLPITPEGKFLAYKGVKNDFYSKHGNGSTVVLQGKVNSSGEIYNGVGEAIEVSRNQVDDNKERHCSFGLHVGSYNYANEWAGSDGRLLVVEVDPADAVSVPTDSQFQKLRTCKYKVVSDITPDRKEIPDTVYSYSDDEANDDEGDDQDENTYDDDFADAMREVRDYIVWQTDRNSDVITEDLRSILNTLGLDHVDLDRILNTLGYITIPSWFHDSLLVVKNPSI